MITDHERFEFMQKLAGSSRDPKGVLLPDWESQFLASWLRSARPTLWFTEGRRRATDRIWMAWGLEINWPFPSTEAVEQPKRVAADIDGCEYLVQIDGRQQCCNDPAIWRRQNGFRYCEMHAETVRKDLKRVGKIIHLLKL